MPAISTIIAGVGLAVGTASAAGNYFNAKDNAATQRQYQDQALAEQQRQEALRKQQMDLDAMRRQRATLRASLQASAVARATATSQGAQFGSLLPGAYGGIEGSAGRTNLATRQNQELGTEMFESNMNLSNIYRNAATASSSAQSNAALFSGMGSLGGALLANSNTIGKIGTWASSKIAPATEEFVG